MSRSILSRLAGLFPVLLLAVLGLTAVAKAVPPVIFDPPNGYSTGGGTCYQVAYGDVNRDGKIDVVSANYNAGTVGVLLGDGLGNFAPVTTLPVEATPWSIELGDLNADGKLDIVAGNTGTLSVFVGDGLGGFGPHSDFGIGGTIQGMAIGDLNADGKPDLVATNQFSAVVMINSTAVPGGAVTFSPITSVPVGGQSEGVAIGDLNGDGKPDLAVANFGSAVVALGNGDGTFGSPTSFPTGAGPQSIAIGDLNGDGKPDLATGNWNGYGDGSTSASVLLGDGLGGFGTNTNFATAGFPNRTTIGDLNGDGKPDLLVSASMLLGDGNTAPTFVKIDLTAGSMGSVITDFNRDGKPDVAVANQGSGVVIFLNNTSCATLDVVAPPVSAQLELSATPNPSSGQTQISFSLPTDGSASIGIYDLLGRRLRQWNMATMSAGRHHVDWNGQADDGHAVSPGMLFYRITAGGQTVKQMLTHL